MSEGQEKFEQTEVEIISGEPLLLPCVSRENLSKKRKWTSHFSGIFYAFTASFLFVSSTFTVKTLGIDILDALLSRLTLQMLITLSFALYKHYPLLTGTAREMLLQILYSIAGTIEFLLFYICVRYINLSDLNTLFYTRVVWTVVLGIIIYRERPSIGTLIAMPLTFLGVVFVTQPSFIFASTLTPANYVSSQFRIIGFIMAIASALISASGVLIYKQLISTSNEIKPSVLNFQLSTSIWLVLVLNQLYRRFFLRIETHWSYFISWRYLLSAGVCLCSVLGSVLIQKAMKRENPAIFSLLGSFDIIFALILQYLFTQIRSNLFDLIGSTLIIISVALIALSKIIHQRRTETSIQTDENKKLNTNSSKC